MYMTITVWTKWERSQKQWSKWLQHTQENLSKCLLILKNYGSFFFLWNPAHDAARKLFDVKHICGAQLEECNDIRPNLTKHKEPGPFLRPSLGLRVRFNTFYKPTCGWTIVICRGIADIQTFVCVECLFYIHSMFLIFNVCLYYSYSNWDYWDWTPVTFVFRQTDR